MKWGEECEVHKCWLAYKKWLMALFRKNIKSDNCYSINYHAIKKNREEREVDEVEGNSNRFSAGKTSV